MSSFSHFTWHSPALEVLNHFRDGDYVSEDDKKHIDSLMDLARNDSNHNNPSILQLFQSILNDATIGRDAKEYYDYCIYSFVDYLATATLDNDPSWFNTSAVNVSDFDQCQPLFPSREWWTGGEETFSPNVLDATINTVTRPDSLTDYLQEASPIFKLCFDAYIERLNDYDIGDYAATAKKEWEWDRRTNVMDLMASPILKSGKAATRFSRDISKLEKNGISTLGHLETKLKDEDFAFSYFNKRKIQTLLQNILSGPIGELCLHGKYIAIGGTSISMDTTRKNYEKHCTHVKDRKPKAEGENKHVGLSIISGPSGSGKTFCAINDIPERAKQLEELDDEAVKGKGLCVVYMEGKTMKKKEEKQGDNFSIKAFIQETVKQALDELFKNQDPQSTIKFPLKETYLTLIIDEVNNVRHILHDESRLDEVFDALGVFCKSRHVIVCGTGYDTVSQNIGTGTQAYKYDMRPWSTEHFKAKAKRVAKRNSRYIVDAVDGSQLLLQLITNGRACEFLIKQIMATQWYKDESARGPMDDFPPPLIPVIVANVAKSYTSSNGLSSLNQESKLLVAQSVLDELRIAARTENNNEPPQFQKLKDAGNQFVVLEAQTLSLMTYNLEGTNGEFQNIKGDEALSVEVSPAITLVLCYMLGISADFFAGWGGFETVVAIDAYLDAVRDAKPEEIVKWKMAKLPSAMPPTSPWSNIREVHEFAKYKVPIDVRNTVFINGPMAPYADIIAPGKLIQVKHKTDKSADIDLVAEVGKVGLLTDKDARAVELVPVIETKSLDAFRRTRTVGRAVTSYFCSMWKSEAEGEVDEITAGLGTTTLSSEQTPFVMHEEATEKAAATRAREFADIAFAKVDEQLKQATKATGLPTATGLPSAHSQGHAPVSSSSTASSSSSLLPEDILDAALQAATAALDAWSAAHPFAATLQAEPAAAKALLIASEEQRIAAEAAEGPPEPEIPTMTREDAKHVFPASQLLHAAEKSAKETTEMKELKVAPLKFTAGWKNTIESVIAHQHRGSKEEKRKEAFAKILFDHSMHQYRTSLSSEDSHFAQASGCIDESSAIPLNAPFKHEEGGKTVDFISVTNAKRMVLKFATKGGKHQRGKDDADLPRSHEDHPYFVHRVAIKKCDVDHDGKLNPDFPHKGEIEQFQKDFMEDGVNLRFLFC